MSKIEWAGFAGVVGVVVIAIAYEPNHDEMDGHDLSAMAIEAAATSHTVALAVSGMT